MIRALTLIPPRCVPGLVPAHMKRPYTLHVSGLYIYLGATAFQWVVVKWKI